MISLKVFIRNREFFKISQIMETGAEQGMWTFTRYQNWMAKRPVWHLPNAADEAPDSDPAETARVKVGGPAPVNEDVDRDPQRPAAKPPAASKPGGPIEIEPVEGGLGELLKRLE